MIRHIFKIIWNERRSNLWIILEFVLVFCVLWFCCDYISLVHRTYKGDPGFDITDTYVIKMEEKLDYEGEGKIDDYGLALTLLDRVKRHPDVEYVALGMFAGPYTGGVSISSYYLNPDVMGDSLYYPVRVREVTSDFFNVFKIPVTSGRVFDWQDVGEKNSVLISAVKEGDFGSYHWLPLMPVGQVRTLSAKPDDPRARLDVIGTTGEFMDALNIHNVSTVFMPLSSRRANLLYNQIVVRVKPGTDKRFPERFNEDMFEQLLLGPYYLASIKPTEDYKDKLSRDVGITGNMNGVYAVTFFLVTNIFLGILGTFWVRTQSRRKEIALRISIGSSKQGVRKMIIMETLIILLISSVIGEIICLSIGGSSFMSALGLPSVDRAEWRIGWDQDVINFALTTLFLAIVSIVAACYPAKSAADTQPAQALHEN